jgi:hypothetical protein
LRRVGPRDLGVLPSTASPASPRTHRNQKPGGMAILGSFSKSLISGFFNTIPPTRSFGTAALGQEDRAHPGDAHLHHPWAHDFERQDALHRPGAAAPDPPRRRADETPPQSSTKRRTPVQAACTSQAPLSRPTDTGCAGSGVHGPPSVMGSRRGWKAPSAGAGLPQRSAVETAMGRESRAGDEAEVGHRRGAEATTLPRASLDGRFRVIGKVRRCARRPWVELFWRLHSGPSRH